MPTPLLARFALGAYLFIAVIHLGSISAGSAIGSSLTKPLLIPLLALYAFAMMRLVLVPAAKWLFVGLLFAWLGDVALMPDGDLWFVLGIAMFLVMQISYVVGFFQLGARDGLSRRRWVLIVFPAFWLVANALLWPELGELRIPIAIYSLALVTMALLSVATGTLIGIGGTLFMISDLLIGVGAAFGTSTGQSLAVMTTYIAAQFIIVSAWIRFGVPRNQREPAN